MIDTILLAVKGHISIRAPPSEEVVFLPCKLAFPPTRLEGRHRCEKGGIHPVIGFRLQESVFEICKIPLQVEAGRRRERNA